MILQEKIFHFQLVLLNSLLSFSYYRLKLLQVIFPSHYIQCKLFFIKLTIIWWSISNFTVIILHFLSQSAKFLEKPHWQKKTDHPGIVTHCILAFIADESSLKIRSVSNSFYNDMVNDFCFIIITSFVQIIYCYKKN